MSGIDRTVLNVLFEETLDRSREVYLQVLEMYLRESPVAVKEICASTDKCDWEAVADRAHSLKSNSLSLGAMRLGELCREIETNSRAGVTSEISAKVRFLQQELPLVLAFLAEEAAQIKRLVA